MSHPLRDKAQADVMRSLEGDARRLRRQVETKQDVVRSWARDAEELDAFAHARLYREVSAYLDACERALDDAVKAIHDAARVMDPDKTNAEDFEEEMT